jgi:hypothetical protein
MLNTSGGQQQSRRACRIEARSRVSGLPPDLALVTAAAARTPALNRSQFLARTMAAALLPKDLSPMVHYLAVPTVAIPTGIAALGTVYLVSNDPERS